MSGLLCILYPKAVLYGKILASFPKMNILTIWLWCYLLLCYLFGLLFIYLFIGQFMVFIIQCNSELSGYNISIPWQFGDLLVLIFVFRSRPKIMNPCFLHQKPKELSHVEHMRKDKNPLIALETAFIFLHPPIRGKSSRICILLQHNSA